MKYLTVCAIFRGENLWIDEWIRYHQTIGVERFYLYNNDIDTSESDTILKPYVESGLVENIHFPGETVQMQAYQDVLATRGSESVWMAFIDLDEFILPRHTDSLPEFLQGYEKYSGLAVHWNLFGSSGLIKTPPNQINHFLYRANERRRSNRIVKSIVRPDRIRISSITNPHFFYPSRGIIVDELRRYINGAQSNYTAELIQINHYIVRSRRYFEEVKSVRASKWLSGQRNQAYWKRNDHNDVFDDEISRRFGHLFEQGDQHGTE